MEIEQDFRDRIFRYLKYRYADMQRDSLRIHLRRISKRLESNGILKRNNLKGIIIKLRKQGWELHEIVAHLDCLDLIERT